MPVIALSSRAMPITLSASGLLGVTLTSRTKSSPTASMPSTSSPAMVRARAVSVASIPVSMNSQSQLKGISIVDYYIRFTSPFSTEYARNGQNEGPGGV